MVVIKLHTEDSMAGLREGVMEMEKRSQQKEIKDLVFAEWGVEDVTQVPGLSIWQDGRFCLLGGIRRCPLNMLVDVALQREMD